MSDLRCTKCEIRKPYEAFDLDRRKSNGRSSWCSLCVRTKTREWRTDKPEAYRASRRKTQLKTKFNMTHEDYEALLKQQGGGCAICGSTSNRNKRHRDGYFPIDHDHSTGRIRGLLCSPCNLLLGHCGDDPVILQKAITYLNESRQNV